MTSVEKLLGILDLTQEEEYLFSGDTIDIGSPSVFGGQVLAQALNAATRTVPEDRIVHSLHGYFILAGDKNKPIYYEVDPIRDGRSFTTRRIVARQDGKAIFNMAASYQLEQEGYNHQIEMLNVPPPESLISYPELIREIAKNYNLDPDKILSKNRPIDIRPVERIDPFNPGSRPPFRHVWFKAKDILPVNRQIHSYVLAYASDFNLLLTALLPHDARLFEGKLKLASLDHAMWFHRDFKADEWLLYALDSPSASNARGFCRGNIFSRDGVLVASVAQEGLIRLRKPKPQ
jgi:acyl-CoA thioesterase-2